MTGAAGTFPAKISSHLRGVLFCRTPSSISSDGFSMFESPFEILKRSSRDQSSRSGLYQGRPEFFLIAHEVDPSICCPVQFAGCQCRVVRTFQTLGLMTFIEVPNRRVSEITQGNIEEADIQIPSLSAGLWRR